MKRGYEMRIGERVEERRGERGRYKKRSGIALSSSTLFTSNIRRDERSK